MRNNLIYLLSFIFFITRVLIAESNSMVLVYEIDSSSNNVLYLPISGELDIIVDWGDGDSSHWVDASFRKHEYNSSGKYVVKLTGKLERFGSTYPSISSYALVAIKSFGNLELQSLSGACCGAKKISYLPPNIPKTVKDLSYMFRDASSFNSDISSWDVSNVTDMRGMFSYARNFNSDLSSWDVSKVTNMSYMFESAESFNSDISSWDVSNVTDMRGMFDFAHNFNSDLSSWDVSKVTNMKNMFAATARFDADLSSWNITNVENMDGMFSYSMYPGILNNIVGYSNYDKLLYAWSKQKVKPNVKLGANNCRYGLVGKIGRDVLTSSPNNWIINDQGMISSEREALVLSYKIKNINNNKISLPLFGNVNVIVDWGDDTDNEAFIKSGIKNHAYKKPGSYNVKIKGRLTHFGVDKGSCPNMYKLDSVKSFGKLDIISLKGAFKNAVNLSYVPNELPQRVRDLSSLFEYAKKFNQNIDSWNIKNVVSTNSMFKNAISFNKPLSSWNTSKITDMSNMFYRALSFNQPIDTWDISNVEYINSMFYSAQKFNKSLSNWDTRSVIEMKNVFSNCKNFDQNIGSWNIGKVKTMEGMFTDVTLSSTNYDNILMEWSSQKVKEGVVFDAGNSQCSENARMARLKLMIEKGWIILDDGVIGDYDFTKKNNNMPSVTTLFQNYPNPFNPVTNIKFYLTSGGPVSLKIYNYRGEVVKELTNNMLNKGFHSFNFDGSLFSSGVYFYRLSGQGFTHQKKMILLK